MGTGGMRLGAGRRGYRAKAEHLPRVDIRVWRRLGYLRAGGRFTWDWNRGGKPSGSVGVLVHDPDSLALQYVVNTDGQQCDASQTIRLEHVQCPYGGTRPWFRCPRCYRRAGLLYLRWTRFACRTCQRVAHASQSCDLLDRSWRKQVKIEARLGAHWKRPKGMRQRTYERLKGALIACEKRRNDVFALWAQRRLPGVASEII